MEQVFTDSVSLTAMELLERKKQGIFTVTKSNQLIPVGTYTAVFVRWEIANSKKTGDSFIKLIFRLTESDYEGREFSAVASPKISKGREPQYNSKLYSIVTTLLGRDLSDNETVNFQELINKPCKVVVAEGKYNSFQGVSQVLKSNQLSMFDSSEAKK
jgi:hypothetical protein